MKLSKTTGISVIAISAIAILTMMQLSFSTSMLDYKSFSSFSLREQSWRKPESYSSDSLPPGDFTKLVNLNNFRFVFGRPCNDNNNNDTLDLIVIVSSAPKNKDKRAALRETWGRKRERVKMVFMVGEVKTQQQQDELDLEFRTYSDMVQGQFHDSYRNLTYKFVMGLKYVVYYCTHAKFVLKTDDDAFVNMPVLLDYIHSIPSNQKDLLLCRIMDGAPAIREPSKWKVGFNEYPRRAYPMYCAGFAILFSYKTVFEIYQEAQKGDFFWVDDAYVTGASFFTAHIYIEHLFFFLNIERKKKI